VFSFSSETIALPTPRGFKPRRAPFGLAPFDREDLNRFGNAL